MSIFVASALVLFMSPVKNAFAHSASPAVARAFSAQEPQGPNEKDAQNNDAQHEDMDDRDIEDGAKEDIDNGAVKDAGVHETDGANNDEDRQADQVDDGEVPPPPAA
jgi:hypothetical protein